jgi:hypothetical protein
MANLLIGARRSPRAWCAGRTSEWGVDGDGAACAVLKLPRGLAPALWAPAGAGFCPLSCSRRDITMAIGPRAAGTRTPVHARQPEVL